jgi:NAD(P)-dependent dehydrogenase (short-subunit alcohol dehydrogenase family)
MGDVLVTGATGGIGSALVPALVSAGHRVIAVGRDVQGLQSLAARTIVADLAQVDRLAGVIGELAPLDALVHCAGVSQVAAVADAPPATWQHTLSVNVAAAAELTRLALPRCAGRAAMWCSSTPPLGCGECLIRPGFCGGSIVWKAGWSHGTQPQSQPLAAALPA